MSENKLPNSDPENPWRSGTLLGGLWECNRAILRWFESQLKSQPSVGEGRATPPSDEAEVLAKRRKRGRKAFEDDHGRLIQMAQAIDAGDVERNEPTAAVRLLPEYGDMLQHNREQFEKRLVDKFNKPEFQQELSQRRKTEEWQAAVAQRKKSKSSS
jgi:hypothetical protein